MGFQELLEALGNERNTLACSLAMMSHQKYRGVRLASNAHRISVASLPRGYPGHPAAYPPSDSHGSGHP